MERGEEYKRQESFTVDPASQTSLESSNGQPSHVSTTSIPTPPPPPPPPITRQRLANLRQNPKQRVPYNSSANHATVLPITITEPTSFSVANNSPEWRQAMKEEVLNCLMDTGSAAAGEPVMKSEGSGEAETSDVVPVKGSNYQHQQQQLMVKYRGIKHPITLDSQTILNCVASASRPLAASHSSRAYDDEEAAARAYDLAALKYWGPGTLINFPVTDYTRDLEEMQNLSREDYLASLRRKGSGFSRGASKCRGTSSSKWDSPLGRMAGADYNNCMQHGEDATTESEYVSGFCMDRKIDLTPYIKWWGPNKSRQAESHGKSSEEANYCSSEDIGSENKPPEWITQPTEPYQLPRLGVSTHEGKQHKRSSVSAMSILTRSAAYKSLQEKALKKEEKDVENDENENKININKMDYGKAVEKSNHDIASEGFGVALGMDGGGMPLQRNTYPLAPFMSAPLMTNYNNIDPLTDPILWSTLVSSVRTRSSQPMEKRQFQTVLKQENAVSLLLAQRKRQYFDCQSAYSVAQQFNKRGAQGSRGVKLQKWCHVSKMKFGTRNVMAPEFSGSGIGQPEFWWL
ncbi:AP2-like ethylene-responsive transcription factor [Tanacetum coccineum]